MFFCIALFLLLQHVNGQTPLTFTKCGGNWDCQNSSDYAYLTFSCEKNKEAKVDLEQLVRDIQAVVSPNLASLTLSDCRYLSLDMALFFGLTLRNLTVTKIHHLEIRASREASPEISQPSGITFKDIDFIPVLPPGTISSPQVQDVTFEEISIGTIEKGAITNGRGMIRSMVWHDITVRNISVGAMVLSMHSEGVFRITSSRLPSMATSTWLQQGGAISILDSSLGDLELSSISANVRYFNFSRNTVEATEKMDIISPEIIFVNNSIGFYISSFPFDWPHIMNFGKLPTPELRLVLRGNGQSRFLLYEFESDGCFIEEDILYKDAVVECSIRFQYFSVKRRECKISDGVFARALCGETCTTAKCEDTSNASCTSTTCKSIRDTTDTSTSSFQDDLFINSIGSLNQPWGTSGILRIFPAIINCSLISVALSFLSCFNV